MVTNGTIEGRLEAVEEAVVELRRKIETRTPDPKWLDRLIGSFEGEPEFDEVARLGREAREGDRSAGEGGP